MSVHPDSMSDSKSQEPKIVCVVILPIENGVRHHFPSTISDGLDELFCLPILMLCSNPQKFMGLFLLSAIGTK
jgi:hypothetical protein